MSDWGIFAVGVGVFLLVAGGILTSVQFEKMGDKDQNDFYPKTRPWF